MEHGVGCLFVNDVLPKLILRVKLYNMYDSMDRDTIKALLEKHTDIISKAAKEEIELYKHTLCPNCNCGGCYKKLPTPKIVPGPDGYPQVINAPFGNSPILEGFAFCPTCQTEFNPRTGLIYKAGETGIISVPKQSLPCDIQTFSDFGEET